MAESDRGDSSVAESDDDDDDGWFPEEDIMDLKRLPLHFLHDPNSSDLRKLLTPRQSTN